MKKRNKVRAVRLEIAKEVIESVFDECDRFDRDETGGRMVGHYSQIRGTLVVKAVGVIEPGPNARRTSTSFFQDGDYQTEVFRRLESRDPSIEHLGNWHTHHVNGYPTLSSGDLETYHRIVNHELHNLDFFYALLVTKKNKEKVGLDRYAVRHYVLFRGENGAQEIHPTDVRMIDTPKIWPVKDDEQVNGRDLSLGRNNKSDRIAEVRARDKCVLGVLYPSMQPRLINRTSTFFWKGLLSLIDGSEIEVRIAEVEEDDKLLYYPVISNTPDPVSKLCQTPFQSASHAIRALELHMNREIYESAANGVRVEEWKC